MRIEGGLFLIWGWPCFQRSLCDSVQLRPRRTSFRLDCHAVADRVNVTREIFRIRTGRQVALPFRLLETLAKSGFSFSPSTIDFTTNSFGILSSGKPGLNHETPHRTARAGEGIGSAQEHLFNSSARSRLVQGFRHKRAYTAS